jgi:hypothetical protein
MLTNKQLEFALHQVQEIQSKKIGENIGITIMTGCDTHDFIVTIEYGFEKLDDGVNYKSMEKTFEFTNSLTEDQCVDYLQDIEKLAKKNQ